MATLLLAGTVARRGAASEFETTLRWPNGDTLAGRLLAADETELSWESPVFAEPLRLRIDALHSIRFPVNRELPAETSEQIVETLLGNRFLGRVAQLDEDSLTIDTALFGRVRLQRSQLRLLSQPVRHANIFEGPRGLEGWSTQTYGRKLSEWRELDSGRLATDTVAAELYRLLPAAGSLDIEAEFHWLKNPSFQIALLTPFAAPTKETVKLETRAGGYVLQVLGSNGRFEQLEELDRDQRSIRLRLRWDPATQELTIYRRQKYVGKLSAPNTSQSGPAGVYIRNTGPQLTLASLKVRGSTQAEIPAVQPNEDLLLLADGETLEGSVLGLDASSDSIQFQDRQGERRTIRWSQAADLRFRAAEDAPTTRDDDELVQCLFHNGELVRGRLVSADNERLLLRVPSAADVLPCRLLDVERVDLNRVFRSVPQNAPQIRVGEATLHGQLVACEADQSLGWLPPGGVAACRLGTEQAARVILDHGASATPRAIGEDLVYLRSGDLIPGQVLSVDEQQVVIASDLVGQRNVPNSALKAIELAATPFVPITGFADPGWQASPHDNVSLAPDQVLFTGSGSLRHDDIVKGNQIEFQMECSAAQVAATLQIVLTGRQGEQSQAIMFYCVQDQFFVMAKNRGLRRSAAAAGRPIKCRLTIGKTLRLELNGAEVYRDALSGDVADLRGIEFLLTANRSAIRNPGIWHPGGANVPLDPEITTLTLRDFRVGKSQSESGSLGLSLREAEPLLTTPRSRRDAPAGQLLVGVNGDLARGELLLLDQHEVRFRSRFQTLSMPRGSVAGLIWLVEGEEPTATRAPQFLLRDGSTISLADNHIRDATIEGVHPDLGLCRLALGHVNEILIGNVASPAHLHSYADWTARAAPEPRFTNEAESHAVDSPLSGETAADFLAVLVDEDGSAQLADYRGKVLVLDFWASWCPPCIRSLPEMMQTVAGFPEDQVALLAVNQMEDANTVREFRRSRGLQIKMALDPQGRIGQQFGIDAVPQTVIVDAEGRIAQVFAGASPRLYAEVRAAIESLLPRD